MVKMYTKRWLCLRVGWQHLMRFPEYVPAFESLETSTKRRARSQERDGELQVSIIILKFGHPSPLFSIHCDYPSKFPLLYRNPL